MSIVEKAAERLKSLHHEPASRIETEADVPAQTPPTLERLQVAPASPPPVAAPAALWPVDYQRLKQLGVLPADNDEAARLADQLRRVKRPLLNNANGKSANPPARAERIVVTSAVPGEGKTFVALNLAMSLAHEPDFEVLLVDADIPKCDITHILGLEGHAGIMDALADEHSNPEDFVVHTDIPNLLVLPVGKPHSLASEWLGSRRMDYVLEKLSATRQHRLVVFDSSPLLATPEAQVLAAHMGQVVMVIGAGHTARQEVSAAMQGLGDAQYVGLVLNMSRLPPGENHYNNYYNQYYSAQREGNA